MSSGSHFFLLCLNILCGYYIYDVSDGMVSWRGVYELHQAEFVTGAFLLFTVMCNIIYISELLKNRKYKRYEAIKNRQRDDQR